jgi:hypothetical protein
LFSKKKKNIFFFSFLCGVLSRFGLENCLKIQIFFSVRMAAVHLMKILQASHRIVATGDHPFLVLVTFPAGTFDATHLAHIRTLMRPDEDLLANPWVAACAEAARAKLAAHLDATSRHDIRSYDLQFNFAMALNGLFAALEQQQQQQGSGDDDITRIIVRTGCCNNAHCPISRYAYECCASVPIPPPCS